jgi:HK97 gp10 family phage protein
VKVKVTVTGLKEAEQALRELSAATGRNVLKRALLRAAEPVVAEEKRLAPVLSGRLRASLATGSKAKRGSRPKVTAVVIIPTVSHAHFAEFGTAYQAPQPFARPAIDSKFPDVVREFARAMREEVNKAVAKARRKAARAAKKG